MNASDWALITLGRDFPGWLITRNRPRRDGIEAYEWEANRKGFLVTSEMHAGLTHLLTCNTHEELRSALLEQKRLEGDLRQRPAFNPAYMR